MSKINCEMCQDLMVLYIDDICSESSSKAVEEHIKGCSKCRKALDEMKKNINEDNILEIDTEKNSEFKIKLGKI